MAVINASKLEGERSVGSRHRIIISFDDKNQLRITVLSVVYR